MKKSTKGALAAAGAAGELTLTEDSCTAWAFDDGETTAGVAYTGQPIVPGDVLTTDCSYTLVATGEHMRATFAVVDPTASGALAAGLTVAQSLTLNAVPVTPPAEIEEGTHALSATISVTFDSGTTDLELATATLSALTLTVSQIHG
jgi:alternate signal-mediated exported protein